MKTIIEKKYINTGFVIGLLILLTINILTYLNTSRHLDDEGLTGTALKIIRYTDVLVYRVADAESKRRGYLLTESGQFLMQYNHAVNQIDTVFGSIKVLTSKTPELKPAVDSLSILLSGRGDVIKELSEFRESKPGEHADLINRGMQTNERIKSIVSEIQKEEREFINRVNAESSKSSEYILMQIIIGSVIGFIVLIAGLVFLNKNLRRRVESEKALEENMNWFSTTLKSIGDGVITPAISIMSAVEGLHFVPGFQHITQTEIILISV